MPWNFHLEKYTLNRMKIQKNVLKCSSQWQSKRLFLLLVIFPTIRMRANKSQVQFNSNPSKKVSIIEKAFIWQMTVRKSIGKHFSKKDFDEWRDQMHFVGREEGSFKLKVLLWHQRGFRNRFVVWRIRQNNLRNT